MSKLLTTSFINDAKSLLENLIHDGFVISFKSIYFNCVGSLVSDLLLSDNDSIFNLTGYFSVCSNFIWLNNGADSLLKPNELNSW